MIHRSGIDDGPLMLKHGDLAVEIAVEVALAQRLAHDLSAGRARDVALPRGDEAVDGEPGERGNLFVHAVQELRQFRIGPLFRRDVEHQDDLAAFLRIVHAARHHEPERLFHAGQGDVLDVGGVIVLPAHDDDFLGTAHDAQVALGVHEAHVPGGEPLPVERGLGRFGIVEVVGDDVVAPDFHHAHTVGGQGLAVLVGNADFAIQNGLAHAGELGRVFAFGHVADNLLRHHELAVEGERLHRGIARVARRHQRRLGKPVAGHEQVRGEAHRRELLLQNAARFGGNHFRAHRPHFEAREIHFGQPVGTQAYVCGKMLDAGIGGGGDGAPVLVNFFHPQERTLSKLERVHLDLIHAREHRHEVASEQPEIMEVRQPRHQPVLGCAAFDGPQGADVRNEVAVREARALGHTRAAGGELEHGGIVMLRDVAVVLLEIDDAGLRDEVFAGYERGPRPFEHVRQHGKGPLVGRIGHDGSLDCLPDVKNLLRLHRIRFGRTHVGERRWQDAAEQASPKDFKERARSVHRKDQRSTGPEPAPVQHLRHLLGVAQQFGVALELLRGVPRRDMENAMFGIPGRRLLQNVDERARKRFGMDLVHHCPLVKWLNKYGYMIDRARHAHRQGEHGCQQRQRPAPAPQFTAQDADGGDARNVQVGSHDEGQRSRRGDGSPQSLHDGLMVGRSHGEQDRQRPRRRFLGDEGTQQRDRKPPVKPQKRTEGFQPPPETVQPARLHRAAGERADRPDDDQSREDVDRSAAQEQHGTGAHVAEDRPEIGAVVQRKLHDEAVGVAAGKRCVHDPAHNPGHEQVKATHAEHHEQGRTRREQGKGEQEGHAHLPAARDKRQHT